MLSVPCAWRQREHQLSECHTAQQAVAGHGAQGQRLCLAVPSQESRTGVTPSQGQLQPTQVSLQEMPPHHLLSAVPRVHDAPAAQRARVQKHHVTMSGTLRPSASDLDTPGGSPERPGSSRRQVLPASFCSANTSPRQHLSGLGTHTQVQCGTPLLRSYLSNGVARREGGPAGVVVHAQ